MWLVMAQCECVRGGFAMRRVRSAKVRGHLSSRIVCIAIATHLRWALVERLSAAQCVSACLIVIAACWGSVRVCVWRLCGAANPSGEGVRPSEPAHCVYSQCNTFALGACRALKRRMVRIVLEVFALSEIRMHGHCIVRRASAFAQISHT